MGEETKNEIFIEINGECKPLGKVENLQIGIDYAKEAKDHCVSNFVTEGSVSFSLSKEQIKLIKKSIGVNKQNKKRTKKLFMSVGYSRNAAEDILNFMTIFKIPRFECTIRSMMQKHIEIKEDKE